MTGPGSAFETAATRSAPMGKQKNDTVTIVSVVILLALPVIFVCLNFWSVAFVNFSYKVLQPVNSYLDKVDLLSDWFRALWSNLLAIFLSILIHELGHVTAGLMAGFNFESITVGPFRVNKVKAISVGVDTQEVKFGLAEMSLERSDHLIRRYLAFIFGGPVANLFCAALIHYLPPHPLTVFFVFYSTAEGIFNLVPVRYLSYTSDGRAIYALLFERNKFRLPGSEHV